MLARGDRPEPALSAVAGDDGPGEKRTTFAGERFDQDGRPAISAATVVDQPPQPKPAPKRQATQEAPPAASEPQPPASFLEEEFLDARSRLDRAVAEAAQTLGEVPQKPRPQRRDFSNPEAYDAALTTWAADQAKLEAVRNTELTRRHHAVRDASEDFFHLSRDRAIEKYPDWAEVAESNDLAITAAMGSAILRLGHEGRDVQFWLGKNPQEAARIARLPPGDQIAAVGKLSERIKATPPAPPRQQRSPAPKTKGELSMDDYAKARMPELRDSARPWRQGFPR